MASVLVNPLLKSLEAAPALVLVSAFAPGDQGAIQAYHFDLDTGSCAPKARTAGVENPFFLAVSADRRFVYSIHAPGKFGGETPEQVAAFQLLNGNGELRPLNRQSTHGTASCYLDIDSSGRTLVVANYVNGNVASYPVSPDGSLQPAASVIQHRGSSVNPDRQKGPHAHCLTISPNQRHAYAADLGLDQVLGYSLDPARGTLTPTRQSFVRTAPGSGPRHLTFHPNGKSLYVINELLNTLTHFSYQADDGTLLERGTVSTLPDDFTGVSYCADVKITPDGKFLYGTNRGHDSLVVCRIGEEGALTRLAIVPSHGKGPQNLAITPDGRWLLCANMPGNAWVVFRIAAETGELQKVGDPLPLTSPSCIRIVIPLPEKP